jgi:hypothetical protein
MGVLVGDDIIERREVRSTSEALKAYTLGRNTVTGEMYCTCMGYRMRRKCKHITEQKEQWQKFE